MPFPPQVQFLQLFNTTSRPLLFHFQNTIPHYVTLSTQGLLEIGRPSQKKPIYIRTYASSVWMPFMPHYFPSTSRCETTIACYLFLQSYSKSHPSAAGSAEPQPLTESRRCLFLHMLHLWLFQLEKTNSD